MAPAQCGCQLIEDAARLPLGAEAEADELRDRGEALRTEWRCESLGGPPPPDDELTESCREAREGVQRILGAALPPGCPLHCLRAPHVHRAARAYRWWEKGQLALLEGDAPPAALCDAVDAVADGLAARERRDHERAMAEAKDRADRPPSPR